MSENIQTQFKNYGKRSDHKAKLEEEEAEMSNLGDKSEITKLSRVADVSAVMPLVENQRFIQNFSVQFDRLY